jgi:hypothetical protein
MHLFCEPAKSKLSLGGGVIDELAKLFSVGDWVVGRVDHVEMPCVAADDDEVLLGEEVHTDDLPDDRRVVQKDKDPQLEANQLWRRKVGNVVADVHILSRPAWIPLARQRFGGRRPSCAMAC